MNAKEIARKHDYRSFPDTLAQEQMADDINQFAKEQLEAVRDKIEKEWFNTVTHHRPPLTKCIELINEQIEKL